MKRLLEASLNLPMIAVGASLLASVAMFLWGAAQTVVAIVSLVTQFSDDKLAIVSMVKLMDAFLVAAALLIFAVAVYELFIGDLELPKWLVIHDLHGLKAMLSNIIILVLAVTFVKHVVEGKDAQGTLFLGIGVALVSAALIAFSRAENHTESQEK